MIVTDCVNTCQCVCYTDWVIVFTLVAEDGFSQYGRMSYKFAQALDAVDRFQWFDICSRASGWDTVVKAAKLPTLLEGEALAVWMELITELQDDYSVTKKEIQLAVMPKKQYRGS